MSRRGMRRAPEQKSYRAKVFKNGGSQAIRLPKACRVAGDEVRIRREGTRLVVEPLPPSETGPGRRIDPSWSDAFVRAFFRGGERASIERGAQGRQRRRESLD